MNDTTAYLLIIDQRLAVTGHAAMWETFAAQHTDLLSWKPSVLDRYYTEATLMSDRPRDTFVMLDRPGMELG